MYVYKYSDYKKLLNDFCLQEQRDKKAFKSRMAQAIGCQLSYLSQVLKGHAHLNLDYAMNACEFMELGSNETLYFLLLVQYARAGTTKLSKFFLSEIKKMQIQKSELKDRFSKTDEIPLDAQHKYYSTWYYSAIHVLLSIPGYSEPNQIASRLNLPIALVQKVIEYLESVELVIKSKNGYVFSKRRIYIGSDSVFIQRHHINWRSKSLQAVEMQAPGSLHFSNVMAVSKKDYEKIREIFTETIIKARNIIGPSSEEELYAMTIDLYAL